MACKRCNGNGMPGYKHNAAGMCFACGKFPGGESGPSDVSAPERARTLREKTIHSLYTYILRAQEEIEKGSPDYWWTDVQEDLQFNLRIADADVRARALAAFAKLGLVASSPSSREGASLSS